MVGVINLFLYILKYPTLPSAVSDVAVLDIAVGHFGHLEVVTVAEISYPFPREVAALTYKTVKNAKVWCSGFTATRPITQAGRSCEIDMTNLNFSNEVSPILNAFLGWFRWFFNDSLRLITSVSPILTWKLGIFLDWVIFPVKGI